MAEDKGCKHGETFSRVNLDDRAAGSVVVRRPDGEWDVPLPVGADPARYRYVCPNCLGVFDHTYEWVCAYVDLDTEEQS